MEVSEQAGTLEEDYQRRVSSRGRAQVASLEPQPSGPVSQELV